MAVPYVPWEYNASASEVTAKKRREGYQIVACEQAHNSVPHWTPGIYRAPLCLIFGHERAGIAPTALTTADVCVEVPVFGMANSLNVAMSLAVVGFEIVRQLDGFGLQAL